MASAHQHGGSSADTRVLKIVAWMQGAYFAFELAIALYTGSVAVLADALHSLSTVGGVILALVAARWARRGKSTTYQTFGWLRSEVIGALFNGLLLFLMALVVLGMGAFRLASPHEPPSTPMLIAAAGAIITEIIAIRLLHKRQKESMNVKGAYLHVMQVFLGSIFIIASALVIQFTGFILIDPILGMVFGLTLFWMAGGMIRSSLSVLMESTPEGLDLKKIIETIESWDGVEDVHHIHAWSLTSGANIFSAHIRVDDYAKGERIQQRAHELLKEDYHVYFATIQVERECSDPGDATAIDLSQTKRRKR